MGGFRRPEEVRELSEAVGKVTELVAEVIELVDEVIDKVAEAIDKVAEAIDKVAEVIDKVADVIDKVAEVIDKVAEVIDLVAEVIELVDDLIEMVDKVIELVAEVIELVDDLMEVVDDQIIDVVEPFDRFVVHIRDVVDPFRDVTEHIFPVIDHIRDISNPFQWVIAAVDTAANGAWRAGQGRNRPLAIISVGTTHAARHDRDSTVAESERNKSVSTSAGTRPPSGRRIPSNALLSFGAELGRCIERVGSGLYDSSSAPDSRATRVSTDARLGRLRHRRRWSPASVRTLRAGMRVHESVFHALPASALAEDMIKESDATGRRMVTPRKAEASETLHPVGFVTGKAPCQSVFAESERSAIVVKDWSRATYGRGAMSRDDGGSRFLHGLQKQACNMSPVSKLEWPASE